MLGERESTSCPRIASHAVQTCRCRLLRLLSGVPRIVLLVFPCDADAVGESARYPLGH